MAAFRRLCLCMPFFAADRARRDSAIASQRCDTPLVLTGRAGASVVVHCVDEHAARLGLRAGMTLGQAHAIAPHLTALPHDPQRDRTALHRLARWAVRFSPLVEAVEPDTLLLDITGCQRLFSGEGNIARQAVEGLRRMGFFTRAAIADTVGAAYALAYCGLGRLTPAGSRGHAYDPDDPVIVPPGQTEAYLAPLPPAALRLDAAVTARLDALGVRTIGDLLKLPRAALPARFGPQLVLRLQQALGEVFEGVATHVPEDVPHVRLSFEHAAHELPQLLPAAEHLLSELFTQLGQRDLALRRLDCVLYFEHMPPRVLSIALSRPSRSTAHVQQLLAQRLEPIDLFAGVCGLMLVAQETAHWRPGQVELFESRAPEQEEELGHLIDRLVARLGPDAVVRTELLDDYQPEAAFRYVSVSEAGSKSCTTGQNPPTACPRPVQLLARPVPIRVIALVPDGPPTWFAYRGREYVVAAATGPERLETAWWRGPDVRRDYFRVTAETGEQFWLFHALDEQRWHLHGAFS